MLRMEIKNLARIENVKSEHEKQLRYTENHKYDMSL